MELEEEIDRYKKKELDEITAAMSDKNKLIFVPKSNGLKDMDLKTRNN